MNKPFIKKDSCKAVFFYLIISNLRNPMEEYNFDNVLLKIVRP